MSVQQFKTTDLLRLEVEADPVGLVNLVQNPNGELGGWAWITPLSSSTMGRDTTLGCLSYARTVAGASNFTTELMPITAGQFAAASYQQTSATNAYHKVRFEWYNSSKVLLSSSTQSSLISPSSSATSAYGPIVAPASTAFLKLRFDLYTSTGVDPTASHIFKFGGASVAKAATSGALGTIRTNLVTNPSFEVNTTGWGAEIAPVADTLTRSTAQFFTGTACASVANGGSTSTSAYMYTNPYLAGITGGETYAFSFYARSAVTPRSAYGIVQWISPSGNVGVNNLTSATTTTTGWTRVSGVFTAPATATQVHLTMGCTASPAYLAAGEVHYFDAVLIEKSNTVGTYFDGSTTAAGGWTYGWTGTAHASTSTATSSNLGTIQPVQYLNFLQECKEIQVHRAGLDVGTMTAEFLSTALDPSQTTILRPGRKIRLTSPDGNNVWQPIFKGRISQASVSYELKDPAVPTSKRARVTLTAIDAIADLANQRRTDGVGTINALPYVLEGCGVPWNVNGNGNQVASATLAAVNDSASALDQIAATRDSTLGYAWVDRFGVLQAWTDPSNAYSSVSGLSDSDVSDIDLSFNTQDCINEVWIKYLRFNSATQETDEISYGPYRDETSISQWGVHSAEFTVQGISEGTVATYAASILTKNATPVVTLNSVTIPLRTSSDVGNWTQYSDLYSGVHSYLTAFPMTVGTWLNITSMEHSITPDKWLMRLGFAKSSVVASPQTIPSPPPNTGPVDGVWISVTPLNGWVNNTEATQYRRDGSIVRLRGNVRSGTYTTAAFNLPAGFRPSQDIRTSGGWNTAAIFITTAGDVKIWSGPGVASEHSVDNISFIAEA